MFKKYIVLVSLGLFLCSAAIAEELERLEEGPNMVVSSRCYNILAQHVYDLEQKVKALEAKVK